jgi:hypothetical protein
LTPNCNSEINTSQEKADYKIVSTIFHNVRIFFEYHYTVLYDKVIRLRVYGFYERENIYAEMLLDFFLHFDVLWTTKERKDSSAVETICMLKFHYFHRNVTKQTNPSKVDNSIVNKSVAILEVSRRIMNTQCVRISLLPNVKDL